MSAIDKKLNKSNDELSVEKAEAAIKDFKKIRHNVRKVIFGQDSVVDNTLITILSGGHALLVGLPGLAKTKMASRVGR